ncbi:increased DNA methylation 1-like [Impatiens glandulifera]|uniref:increased DNA methylation 1-like n=1 Tax=Impatiens glandulifera TaxID=253017 RepID=UPI001FB0E813|nr:increased DNA methylation 1-like [Impatiens glandulifera]
MACLRIHGTKLAEIPFIATCEKYRNKGMCKRLLFGIEWALRHLQIENLVISFSKEMASHWIRHHRFKKIESSLEEDIRHTKTLLFFHNTTRIQKTLIRKPEKSKIVFDVDLNLAVEDQGQIE